MRACVACVATVLMSGARGLVAPPQARVAGRSHARGARPRQSLVDDDATSPRRDSAGAPADDTLTEARKDETLAEALARPQYEVLSSIVTIISCAIYAIATLELPETVLASLETAEFGISVFFLIEYGLRWTARGLDPRYVFEFLSLVDLVSFLPTFLAFLPVPSSLAFLRLLRVLRLQRLLTDVETFRQFRVTSGLSSLSSGDRMRDATLLQLARVVLSLFTLLFVASGLIFAAEHDKNEMMPDFFSALYFGLTTLTTVGFGDIVPITPAGRLVVGASTIVGIAVIPLQLTGLAETLLKENRARDARALRRPKSIRLDRLKIQCANCGEKAHRKDAAFCFRCGDALPDDPPDDSDRDVT